MDPNQTPDPVNPVAPVADPMGMPAVDPNAGMPQAPVEPTMPTPPAMPEEPIAPQVPEPVAPAVPEPQAPVTEEPTVGTGDVGTGMPPTTPPAV